MITKVLDFGSKEGTLSKWENENFIRELMRDCLLDSEYVQCNNDWNKVTGYCHLSEYDDVVTELLLEGGNTMYVYFYGYNYIDPNMQDELFKKINDFCKDKDGLTIKVHMEPLEKGREDDINPTSIYLTFFERT